MYNDNYLKLGFTSVMTNGEIQPQFVLCLEVLAHGSLKEAMSASQVKICKKH